MRFNVLLILVFSAFCSIGQTDSTKWKLELNNCFVSNGYIFQNEHLYEFGLKVDHIKSTTSGKSNGENISLIAGGQLTKHRDITYLNPFITFRYFKPFKVIGGVVSLSYSYRNINNLSSSCITPEIGININKIFNIKYGYNLFLGNKYDWVSNHRIAIRLMLY